MLARSGEITDPCPVPRSLVVTTPSSRTPALSHLRIRRMMRESPIRCSTKRESQMVASVPLVGPALLDFTVNGRGSRRPGYPPGNRAHWPGTPLVNNYRGPTVAPHNAYRTDPG